MALERHLWTYERNSSFPQSRSHALVFCSGGKESWSRPTVECCPRAERYKQTLYTKATVEMKVRFNIMKINVPYSLQ